MKTLIPLILMLTARYAAPAQLQGQARQPIIDMHMHADQFVPAGTPLICRPEPCRGDGGSALPIDQVRQQTVAAMKRYNIVTGFLSGPDLETVQRWVAAAPGRFIPSPFIMRPGQFSPDLLRAEYAAGRLAGMGEIATQLNGIAPNDPALEPYFQLAEELDLPVLIHTEGIGPHLPGFRSAAGNPLLLEDVLVRHPKLRIYMENSGYPYLGETIAMMYQYPQLHGDLSTITWVIPRSAFYQYLEGLIRAGLGKRLMFGTDQMVWPEVIGKAVQAIEQAEFLTAEQKRDILFHNAARFLRLEVEPSASTPGR